MSLTNTNSPHENNLEVIVDVLKEGLELVETTRQEQNTLFYLVPIFMSPIKVDEKKLEQLTSTLYHKKNTYVPQFREEVEFIDKGESYVRVCLVSDLGDRYIEVLHRYYKGSAGEVSLDEKPEIDIDLKSKLNYVDEVFKLREEKELKELALWLFDLMKEENPNLTYEKLGEIIKQTIYKNLSNMKEANGKGVAVPPYSRMSFS